MKKTFTMILAVLICMSSLLALPISASAEDISYLATVYDTDGEGLSLKADADINSARYGVIPEGTAIYIDRRSDGWGHTYYNGRNGWV